MNRVVRTEEWEWGGRGLWIEVVGGTKAREVVRVQGEDGNG